MSLFDTPSTILRLIQEAEQLKLSPDQEMPMPEGEGSGVGDVATELTAANPTPTPAPQGAPTMQIPGMPSPSSPNSTLTKTVISGQLVAAQLSQLKSIITNTEKDFQKGDVDIDAAGASLSTLLIALSNSATALTTFIQASSGGQPPVDAAPQLPVEAAPVEAPLPTVPDFAKNGGGV